MYTVNTNSIVVCFDVDDTLVMWGRVNPDLRIGDQELTVNKRNVESLKRHFARGHHIIVWSAGGHIWAETIVKALGLQDHVHQVMDKPRWYVDDLPADKWMDRYYYGLTNDADVDSR